MRKETIRQGIVTHLIPKAVKKPRTNARDGQEGTRGTKAERIVGGCVRQCWRKTLTRLGG